MRTETLQFKVSEQERKLIEKCAKDEATTVSRFVRGSVLLQMAMEGNGEAVKIIAREVGEKAYAEFRRKFMSSKVTGEAQG